MKTENDNNTQEAASLHAMDREPASTKRVKKSWWAVAGDGRVVHVEGHSCAPDSPNMWWCPAIGYSMSEGHHLFAREQDAVRKALAEAEREAAKWDIAVKRLKSRLSIVESSA